MKKKKKNTNLTGENRSHNFTKINNTLNKAYHMGNSFSTFTVLEYHN